MTPPRRRRSVLKLIGTGLSGSAAAGVAADRGADAAWAVVQGDTCTTVTPLSGDQPAAAFYDWEPAPSHLWSSLGTEHLQRADGSVVFLYDGPDALSLVFVHGKVQGDGDGGSVSMTVSGLPPDGEWVVEDDDYDSPSNFDVWAHAGTASEIDWTWDAGRTDGAAFAGVTADATIRIAPRFNADATLYGVHYDGTVETWEFLSADGADPERIPLSMDAPITVTGDGCPGGGSDTGSRGGTGGDGDGDGGDGREGQDDGDRERTKHERKRAKHREKHERKRRKHREKHQRKRRKHRRKERKHRRKQQKHRRKHRKSQRKHAKH